MSKYVKKQRDWTDLRDLNLKDRTCKRKVGMFGNAHIIPLSNGSMAFLRVFDRKLKYLWNKHFNGGLRQKHKQLLRSKNMAAGRFGETCLEKW